MSILPPKKEKIKKSCLKSLNVLCRGLRRHMTVLIITNFQFKIFTNFVMTSNGDGSGS
jgi:hypothetical protein